MELAYTECDHIDFFQLFVFSLPLSHGMAGIPISYLGHVRYNIVAFPSLYAIRE